jgi:putative transposase
LAAFARRRADPPENTTLIHGLLLQRHSGRGEERRHDGRVAVDQRNTRWCSDALEIGCDNGEKVRVAFALDCYDREAVGHVATTGGITAEDVQDLMVATVEHRYERVDRVPEPIEWLSDNGSPYTARDTRAFARDIGLVPRTTPVSSPQSNGMAEAFVRTLKRDYVRVNRDQTPRPLLTSCRAGSSTITTCIPTARWATDHHASTSRKPARPCQAFRGQQQPMSALKVVAPTVDQSSEVGGGPSSPRSTRA